MRKLVNPYVVAFIAGLALTSATHARDGRHGALAAGAAVGLVGGAILGSALSNNAVAEPVYVEPPPQPVCFLEQRRVPNTYNSSWHIEDVRVCQ
jgi:hypothetical protein